MKILQLKLENITSLAGQHQLDFEQEPLASAGLIAITGMTGSGKSSLLDAMCLALFNKVPRLREASGKLADISGDSIEIDSPSNLLRRGTAFGFAEVIFMAQDNKRYCARWSVKRARDKATGKLQAIQRELRCMEDNQIIATKATEVGQQIDRLLGLDFKQFTKTVLLAQSEVTAFIKANDNERAALLEYLTDSGIYSKIGTLAFDKNKQAASQVSSIERKIGEQQPLDAEARVNLQQQIEQAQANQHTQEKQLKQLEQHLQWYKQLDVLQHSVQHARQQETLTQQQWANFGPQQQLLYQLQQFEPIRSQFEQFTEVSRQIQEKQQLQQHKQQALLSLQQEQAHIQQQLKKCEQQQLQQQQTQQQHTPLIKQALKTELALQHLQQQMLAEQNKLLVNKNNLSNAQQQLQSLLKQQEQLKESCQQHEQQLQQTQTLALFDHDQRAANQFARMASQRTELLAQDVNALKLSTEQQRQQIKQQTQRLAQLTEQYRSPEQLEQQQQQLELQLRKQERFISLCDNIADKLKQWQAIEQAREHGQQQLTALQLQQAEHLKALQAAQLTVTNARTQAEATEKIWQQQQLISQHSVEQLREQLKPDQPCMVCGSTVHPYTHHEQLAAVLDHATHQQYLQAKKYLEQCQLQWQQADKQQAALLQQQQLLLQQQENLQQSRQQLLAEIEQTSSNFYQQIQRQLTPEHAHEVLQHKRLEFGQQTKQLEQQLQELKQLLAEWHNSRQQQSALQQLLDRRMQLEAMEQDYIQPLSVTWQQQWQQDYQQMAASMQQQLKRRLTARQAVEHTQQQKIMLDKQQHEQQVLLNHLQHESTQLQQTVQQLVKQQQVAAGQLAQLLGESGIATINNSQQWQQWLDDQGAHYQQQLAHALQQQQRQQEAQLSLQADIQALSTQLAEINQTLQQQQQKIAEWQRNHPELNESIVQQLLQLSHADKTSLQTQQRQLESALEQARTTMAVLVSQQEQHQLYQPQASLEQLREQQRLAQQALQQQQEVLHQLGVQLQLDNHIRQQAQRYANELEKARAEHQRWDKIASLIGSADGAKFKRIAQQYHLQMLVSLANQHLIKLSPRYEIRHVDNSLNLSIVDHFMNDEIRAVASLSGGESFLISLALALGIASMASGHTRLESLFIDEGFGTLDQNSLHMVMDALDRLQSQGRKVIVISHISEMHERIPVKIQVIPQGSGASKIEVTG